MRTHPPGLARNDTGHAAIARQPWPKIGRIDQDVESGRFRRMVLHSADTTTSRTMEMRLPRAVPILGEVIAMSPNETRNWVIDTLLISAVYTCPRLRQTWVDTWVAGGATLADRSDRITPIATTISGACRV